MHIQSKYGPRREKTYLRGFCQSEFHTSLLSYRDWLENRNFTYSRFTYDAFQIANSIGADQTARMRRLVYDCDFRKPPKTDFLAWRPNYTAKLERIQRTTFTQPQLNRNLSPTIRATKLKTIEPQNYYRKQLLPIRRGVLTKVNFLNQHYG